MDYEKVSLLINERMENAKNRKLTLVNDDCSVGEGGLVTCEDHVVLSGHASQKVHSRHLKLENME